ncbi:MAG: hypothetical protein M1817_003013 [Caeruleum heppii]|nr:MAG: hypothetical protein M1817_003013 [Caeruleum heppii]
MASPSTQLDEGLSSGLRALSSRVMNDPSSSAIVIVFTLFLVLCTTRIVSGLNLASHKVGDDAAKPVPMLPYWIPFLGHVLSFATDPKGLMQGARDKTPHGAFAIHMAGTAHNVFVTPSLVKRILAKRASVLEFISIEWFILNRVFGAPKHVKDAYLDNFPAFFEVDSGVLLRGPGFVKMLATAVRAMEEQIPELVSFTSSPIDQSMWERVSDVNVVEGSRGEVVEANLFVLLRNFLGQVATSSLMGRAFQDNFPEVLQHLWTFDRNFPWLLSGLPRWLPVPGLTRAHLARRQLHRAVEAWHVALDLLEEGEDPGVEWREMDDVSDYMRGRYKVWKTTGLTPKERAPADFSIVWAMNANANNLCVWMVMRILADPSLARQVRDEIKPYVSVTQPEPILGMASSPRMKMSAEGLATQCPLFKGTYLESLRLDSASSSVRVVKEDFTIRESDSDAARAGVAAETYAVKAGSYVQIPHHVHQTDPRYYPDPKVFDPTRFRVPGNPSAVDAGTLKPYGGGHSMCKGRNFAERECLAFVAGILMLWDIEPADGKEWRIPGHISATGVALPAKEIRVRIRRREVD